MRRGLKSRAGDPSHRLRLVHHRVEAGIPLLLFRLSEVYPSRQLPDCQQVDPFCDPFLLQGREAGDGRVDSDGPQIGVESHAPPQSQKAAPLRTLFRRQSVPFRPADTAEQDRIGAFTDLEGIFRKGRTGLIQSCSADETGGEFEADFVLCPTPLQYGDCRIHDFRTDPVPG